MRALYRDAPFLCSGGAIDFVYLRSGTTMPGRHSGDQVHKVKKTAAPSFLLPEVYLTCRFELEVAVRLRGYGGPTIAMGSGRFQTALAPGAAGWGAAQWIGNFTQARAEFELQADSKVLQATAYGSRLGCF